MGCSFPGLLVERDGGAEGLELRNQYLTEFPLSTYRKSSPAPSGIGTLHLGPPQSHWEDTHQISGTWHSAGL